MHRAQQMSNDEPFESEEEEEGGGSQRSQQPAVAGARAEVSDGATTRTAAPLPSASVGRLQGGPSLRARTTMRRKRQLLTLGPRRGRYVGRAAPPRRPGASSTTATGCWSMPTLGQMIGSRTRTAP